MIIEHFKSKCFEYEFIEISENLRGWELRARRGATKFKCPSKLLGHPVVSLNGTFTLYDADTIDVSGMHTENVADMSNMFSFSNTKTIDLSSFKFNKVRLFDQAFYGCHAEEIKFGNNPASNIVSSDRAFMVCTELKSLDVSSFQSKKIHSLDNIFNECINLRYLNLIGIGTDRLCYKSGCFNKLSNIVLIETDNEEIAEYVREDLGMEIIKYTGNNPNTIRNKVKLLGNNRTCILYSNLNQKDKG